MVKQQLSVAVPSTVVKEAPTAVFGAHNAVQSVLNGIGDPETRLGELETVLRIIRRVICELSGAVGTQQNHRSGPELSVTCKPDAVETPRSRRQSVRGSPYRLIWLGALSKLAC